MAAADTVTLTPAEARVLAMYLAAEHIAGVTATACVDWEDVPHLDEASWLLLCDAIVGAVARTLRHHVRFNENKYDIDARLLAERAEGQR